MDNFVQSVCESQETRNWNDSWFSMDNNNDKVFTTSVARITLKNKYQVVN